MAGFAQKQGSEEQTEAYLAELRELFEQRSLPYGRPEDLSSFVQALGKNAALADEMRSMLRSILFREEEQIGRMELLELLALAVGGPPAGEPAPVTQAAVRQLFTFVNQSMRMPAFGDWESPAELADTQAEIPLTASDILATTAPDLPALPIAEPEPAPGPRERYAAQGKPEPSVSAPTPEAERQTARYVEEPEAEVPAGRRSWQVPIFVGGLLLATGLGFAVGRHALPGTQAALQNAGSAAEEVQKPMRLEVCVRAPQKGVTHSSLNAQMQEAHQLMDGTLYTQALPLLQDVARLDPGYPGVGLDISQSLLRLHRLPSARTAIDREINQSECLAKLPKDELDRYCTAQYEPGAQSSCRSQLTHQRQAAQMQAALVHIEMGHAISDSGDAAALSELTQDADGSRKNSNTAPAQSAAH